MQSFELVPEHDHNRPDWVPAAKIVNVSTFQRSFFGDIEAIRANKKATLFEQARLQGIPKEAVDVFWELKKAHL